MTQLSPTALEAAAKAIFKRSIYHGYDDETIASEWARTSYLHRNVATAAITAYLAQREKEGWVMVPKAVGSDKLSTTTITAEFIDARSSAERG